MAVRSTQGQNKAVRKGGGGRHPHTFNYSNEITIEIHFKTFCFLNKYIIVMK